LVSLNQPALIADYFFTILRYALFARILLSWIPHNPENPLLKILYEGTEPLLAPFRRLMPRSALPIDLSPLIAMLVLSIIHQTVVSALSRI
jgi:YggT family protein